MKKRILTALAAVGAVAVTSGTATVLLADQASAAVGHHRILGKA